MNIYGHVIGVIGLVSAFAVAEQPSGAYRLWCAPSAVKIMRDTPDPTTQPVTTSTARPTTWCEPHLRAARREHEAIQVVIQAGREPLKGVRVSMGPWDGPDGSAKLLTQLYRVAYVHLPAHKADFPDPLPPWTPTDIPAGKNQPVWIDVAIGPNVPAGEYRSSVRIEPQGMTPQTLPIRLTVWPFTLPETPHLRTALGISEGHVALMHGVDLNTPAGRGLITKYYEALLERRISAYSPPMPLTSPEALKYLRDPRCTSYTIPYSKNDAELRQTVETLRKAGVLGKGCFYPVDEPVSSDQYDQLKEACRRIHTLDARLKVVTPYFRNSGFDSKADIYALLTGYVDIWCYNTGFYTGYPQEKQLAERRTAGDETWSYVCCGPGKPHTNFFVDMNALAHRLLFWQQRLYHCHGFLYWSTTYWHPSICKDPWTDMATVKDINTNLYGDGSLFYPGKKVGIDGPVTSIRLENIREGLEDYEVLWLYEQKCGPKPVESMIRKVTTGWTQFSNSPADVEQVRGEIAAAIVR